MNDRAIFVPKTTLIRGHFLSDRCASPPTRRRSRDVAYLSVHTHTQPVWYVNGPTITGLLGPWPRPTGMNRSRHRSSTAMFVPSLSVPRTRSCRRPSHRRGPAPVPAMPSVQHRRRHEYMSRVLGRPSSA